MSTMLIIKGNILYTEESSEFKIYEDSYIISKNGKIIDITKELPEKYRNLPVTDYKDSLIIPGFYDLHLHGGQYLQRGTGMNKPLLEWLTDYTYDLEKDFEDSDFAEEVYGMFADDLIRNGTLGSAVFATSSTKGTEVLFEIFKKKKLRGYIGKVEMTRNAPDFIKETDEEYLLGMEYLIDKYKDEEKVRPILTPRFAVTSTEESLKNMGELAAKDNIPVQSHIGENLQEIQAVKEMYPWAEDYASVYDNFGLYGTTPTIMAHGIYMEDNEINLSKNPNLWIAHCPDSNINIISGICPVKKYLEKGIKVGLGTDIAGGHNIQMKETLVKAIQLSKILTLYDPTATPLTLSEAFYMATACGGEFFGKVGKIKAGYDLDILVIDDHRLYKERYSLTDRLEKFLYSGDDRWIKARYIQGELL